ncbi:MAG: hypothetical protein EOO78_32150 [Oxalobacteraceae bacterium]|nr:MAG: hypothetical protein EOO78_32150 [Oxalobacteraceae bacterium]
MTVLARAFEADAVFSEREIALIEPVANAVAVPQPADERCIRQSLGGLSAALPSQSTDAMSGKLKLATYQTMLDGCDERALAYACRRCLDELDWMPTVHQLKERMALWISPEESAIRRARAIMRTGRREVADYAVVITAEQIRAMKPEFRRMGLTAGFITQEQVDAAFADVEQAEAA